jgi:elongation factor Ts
MMSMRPQSERERNVFIEQARESGKPENIIEKMVEGRHAQVLRGSCLLSQAFVMNPDLTVGKAVKAAGRTGYRRTGQIAGFARFQLGEGIEKEESDFAAEVAAAAKG